MAERVLLVVVDFDKRNSWPSEDIALELGELVSSCGGVTASRVFCKCQKINPAYLIGTGKVQEIAELVAAGDVDTVIFSHDLKGSQQRNLEEALNVKTIDRTQLILDIFARRAKSQEGKMQVELAQLEYLLPRLTGKGQELSGQAGGIGTVGPGETKLEVDRRKITARIDRLKKDLKGVSSNRQLKRKKRTQDHIPTVSLVGYTSAGKSTLLNALTDAHQVTHESLFTTLDPLSRQLLLPNHRTIVLSDTVGFMHELPHHLIESFKATLEEVTESDLLLHVVDLSNSRFRNLYEAVEDILKELKAGEKPTLTVFNKIDRLEDRQFLEDLKSNFPNSVFVSALTKENLPELLEKIHEFLIPSTMDVDVNLPLKRMDLVNLIHKEGKVHSIEYRGDSIHVKATVPLKLAYQIQHAK